VLCYNFDIKPQLKYATALDLAVNPAGMATKFRAAKYELSETKANSWYLATQRKLTFGEAENDLSLVDQINRDSELKHEDTGVQNVTDGKIHLQCTIPSYGAVICVLKKAE
jgi:hypothetical protein